MVKSTEAWLHSFVDDVRVFFFVMVKFTEVWLRSFVDEVRIRVPWCFLSFE